MQLKTEMISKNIKQPTIIPRNKFVNHFSEDLNFKIPPDPPSDI